MRPLLTVTAVCCRAWPVGIGMAIGRCGYCGERPVVDPDRTRWANLRNQEQEQP